MIPVEKILDEIEEQARQGSCKTCKWCIAYKVPERLESGAVLTRDCEIQGNVNPIWFTDNDLDRKAYPWICDEGRWESDGRQLEICMAYQSNNGVAVVREGNDYSVGCAGHRDFMIDLAEAIRLSHSIRDNDLAKLIVKLNEAKESLPPGCTGK